MASIISMVLSFSLLLLLLNQSSAAPDSSVLAKACSSTKYPDVCAATFKSDPRSDQAPNTNELARIGIELSATKAKETLAHVSDLLNKSADYLEWGKLSACKSFYSTTPSTVASGLKLFDQKNFTGAHDSVASLNSASVLCNNLDVPVLGETNRFVLGFSDDVMTIIRSLF